MIGARFDDLTGTSPSFRLVEPAGVIEALRVEDVAPAIEAAEGGAARGLWVAGFVAYEAAPGLDPSLSVRSRRDGDPFDRLPLAWFGLFDRREEAVLPRPRDDAQPPDGAWEPSVDRGTYDAAIARIRERIAAGDTYQVNYTLRLLSTVEGDERGLYRDLCFAQRGAHSAYLNTGRYRVLSASPELFFRVDGASLTTRPMKGTAPRGRWAEEDLAVASGLRASVKDRAENAMIVDLLRSDLGRVARTGTVEWSRVFEPERYETVWQLTSTVSAELEPATSILGVFRALFPSGSVTGAPKVRTMQLIAELEDSPRGVYCGSVGFLAPPGAVGPSASFNVAIRTVVVDAETHVAEYGVGGGVTWDSSASGEFDETVAKARVLTARRPPFELLETMRREPGEPIRHLDEHVARLRGSAGYFGFEFDEPGTRAVLEDAGHGSDRPLRVRLRLARTGKTEVGVTPIDPAEHEPVRVGLDPVAVDETDVFVFHKTSMRDRYREARARQPDADDVLLVNRAGQVTESTAANVAVKLDGRWWTPPLEAGLLPGIGRLVALAAGELAERPVTVEELLDAEQIALVSDTRGWRRAELVQDRYSGSGAISGNE
ncbi:MAG: aminodeoxychorismate synthase component I [Actinomycetota bacterium]|nr:aminodeoxychorismate synthase component I [Actinomycetota bacterium]